MKSPKWKKGQPTMVGDYLIRCGDIDKDANQQFITAIDSAIAQKKGGAE